jgi:lipopolysaccharide transport system ATP-binding protein
MSNSITIRNVELDYYVYSVRAQSIRSAAFNVAVGGKLYRKGSDLAVVRALAGVSLSLKDGDRLALVGHNGSGKTTLLKVIAGIYEPTRGEVEVNGNLTPLIAPSLGLDFEATGLDNIKNLGLMRLMTKRQIAERTDSIIEFSGLGDFVRLPIRTYSQGMIARLTFAVATEFPVDILVLDEWLGAGDESFMQKAAERMHCMAENAKIMVLATHNVHLMDMVCNKVCEMSAGKIVFFGAVEDWKVSRQPA